MEEAASPVARPRLPCEFEIPRAAKIKSTARAAVWAVAGLIVFLVAWSAAVDARGRIVVDVVGLLVSAAAWRWVSRRPGSVKMDDEGLLIREGRTTRIVKWTAISEASFGAERRRSAMPHGTVDAVVRFADWHASDGRSPDPYLVPSDRGAFDPSSAVADEHGRTLASFPSTLGWSFFVALRAEACARGIRIVHADGREATR